MQSSANVTFQSQSLPTTQPALSTLVAMNYDQLDELLSRLIALRSGLNPSTGAGVSTGFPLPMREIAKFAQKTAQKWQRLPTTRLVKQQTTTTRPVMTLNLFWAPMIQMKTSSPLRSKSNIDLNSTTTRSIEISESGYLRISC